MGAIFYGDILNCIFLNENIWIAKNKPWDMFLDV